MQAMWSWGSLGKAIALLMACMLLSASLAAQQETRGGTQSGGMDTHLFRPAVDSKGFITVNGTEVLGNRNLSFGLVLDYGRNLLRTQNGDSAVGDDGEPCRRGRCEGDGETLPDLGAGGHNVGALVDNSFQGTFSFNYGILNQAVVGVSIPVILMTGNEAYGIGPSAMRSVRSVR